MFCEKKDWVGSLRASRAGQPTRCNPRPRAHDFTTHRATAPSRTQAGRRQGERGMHIAAAHITLYVSCRTDVRRATVDRAQDERGQHPRNSPLACRQSVLELADGLAKTKRLAARIISAKQVTKASGVRQISNCLAWDRSACFWLGLE